MKLFGAIVRKLKAGEQKLAEDLSRRRQSVFERFPLLFTMLGTFGLVATFYGFEGIIDSVDLLNNNPAILLLIGVGTLVVTGTLYDKLK